MRTFYNILKIILHEYKCNLVSAVYCTRPVLSNSEAVFDINLCGFARSFVKSFARQSSCAMTFKQFAHNISDVGLMHIAAIILMHFRCHDINRS